MPALSPEQPPAEHAPTPVEPQKPEPVPTQADIEAQSQPPPEEEPEPLGPKPSATGFEMAFNLGYQPWIGGPKTDGNSGLLVPQMVLGARLLWPLSFGVEINSGFDVAGTSGTSFIAAINPGFYVRGHIQQYKERLGFDAWGGVGLQPLAVQVVALKATSNAGTASLDPNSIDPNSVQSQILRQTGGVSRVHTVQSINVPFELGGSFYLTEGFGFDLALALTLWLPQQSCLHNGSDHVCTDSGLKSQTSLFIGAGVTFLP